MTGRRPEVGSRRSWRRWVRKRRRGDDEHGFPPPRGPRKRKWLIGIAIAVVVAVAVAVVIIKPWRPSGCGDGLDKVEIGYRGQVRDECVGITDSYAFETRFKNVIKAMRAENDYAAAEGRGNYVTVAYMGPLTHPDPRVLHRLEGAIAGQRQANREFFPEVRPRIRVVLANIGSDASRWPQVAEDLLKMAVGRDHLVAVAGVGLSQAQTKDAARRLSTAALPMVADVVTAGELNKVAVDGLARVNPTVEEEVAVVGTYLRDKTKLRRATQVVSDDVTDFYTKALSKAFEQNAKISPFWKAGGSFRDPFGKNPGPQFDTIIRNLCLGPESPQMVLFAGRAADLPLFIQRLGTRRCHPEPITVVTGSDAVLLTVGNKDTNRARDALASAHNPISLVYAPLVEPSILSDKRFNKDWRQYERFQRAFAEVGFDPEHLATAWAVMAHDAMITIADCIHRASSGGNPPTPCDVRSQVYLTRANSAVVGASGRIELDAGTGDRRGMNLPVLRFNPRGKPVLLAQ